MGVAMMNEPKQSLAGKRSSFRSISSSIARQKSTIEWPISDVSSDLTVEVGTASFALHKFPLISRSGRIRRILLSDSSKASCRITLQSVPGGAQAFEVAAKFCYGVNNNHTEIITLPDIGMLRCVAEFLEMTNEYAERNLVTRTESYLKETVLPNIANSISVLHQCENLLPVAEDINLVNRLITSIANNACKEQLSSGLSKLEQKFPTTVEIEASNWWGNSLAVLRLDFFQRVVSALRLIGLRQDIICRILINYAQSFLQSSAVREPQMLTGKCINLEPQNKQRVIVEAIVSLLPKPSRKSSVPEAFLSSLLKTAMVSEASAACRADLERRIALHLDKAVLEDILIPTSSHGNSNYSCLYETDTILRIFSIFLKLDEDDEDDDIENHLSYDDQVMSYDFSSSFSRKQSSSIKVSKLLDSYLAEIALDSNMTPSKFISLAEILPDHARVATDGLYKAVDVFLKVHPNMKESERHRLCKTIDCQKLSQEACRHAAQNERLPVQMAVQVLYFEQTRLRNAMNNGSQHQHSQFLFGALNGQRSGAGSGTASPRDNYASVRRENRELKLEVARMRMRLTDLEKDHVSMKQELVGGGEGGLNDDRGNKLLKSLTKKLGKLNNLFSFRGNGKSMIKREGSRCGSESRFFFLKQRHHSVS